MFCQHIVGFCYFQMLHTDIEFIFERKLEMIVWHITRCWFTVALVACIPVEAFWVSGLRRRRRKQRQQVYCIPTSCNRMVSVWYGTKHFPFHIEQDHSVVLYACQMFQHCPMDKIAKTIAIGLTYYHWWFTMTFCTLFWLFKWPMHTDYAL